MSIWLVVVFFLRGSTHLVCMRSSTVRVKLRTGQICVAFTSLAYGRMDWLKRYTGVWYRASQKIALFSFNHFNRFFDIKKIGTVYTYMHESKVSQTFHYR